MSSILYAHNKDAYEAAVSMLDEVGKAAIIHPTGTGKSFIGFNLCKDAADKTVCWLSPSEYIFQTQIENWLSVGGEPLPNIKFYTYAKLMMMDESELEEIDPSYIVLDEFHRCGAEMWGQAVESLLQMYSSVPMLGLTATNIRYLDNQRNMAEELFDGNVASEITLGEAIVRGILTPPKYVLSVYSYQKSLEKYERRVRRLNTAARDAAEEYLDALKRALEKADGLDEIFYKHMPDKHGKYIVFCSDLEHMEEMKNLVPEWFAKVDRAPHIYTAYSDDPETKQAFKSFKEDTEKHLKLLFCIDMLNEGIHVADVDGVILLRPTVSPIIYKQQIGRAFSAGKKNNAVIFDIVMNIDNIYSISTVQQEMEMAMNYFIQIGEGGAIVNERFDVIDEVKDCRYLFDKLNDNLSASWDQMYAHAKAYYEEFGNLMVEKRYKTKEGYSLGAWLQTQRRVRNGADQGILTQEQIKKLDAIGMRWDSITDVSWERNFAAAKKYYEEHGNLKVPARYKTDEDLQLGKWISNLRRWMRLGVCPKYLTPERKEMLESIGMVWDVRSSTWERNYAAASKYYKEHGDLNVPIKYKTEDGLELGVWTANVQSVYRGTHKKGVLTEEQIAALEKIGMCWDTKFEQQWLKFYEEASLFFDENKHLKVPAVYVSPSGARLGKWISRQREDYKKGELSEQKIAKLNELNMIWQKPDSWEFRYNLAKKYLEDTGKASISQTVVVDGIWIGKWLSEQRKRLSDPKCKLTDEQKALLNELLNG